MKRRRPLQARRVVLHRCENEDEAQMWAGAYQQVLKSLGIAAWWRVRIDPADAGGALLVGVDYEPRPLEGRQP